MRIPRCSPIERITQDRMSDMPRMHPDLMGAAGFETTAKHSSMAQELLRREMADGHALGTHGRESASIVAVAGVARAQGSTAPRRGPLDNRKVLTLKGMGAKLGREMFLRLCMLGNDQQTTCVFINAMNDSRSRGIIARQYR